MALSKKGANKACCQMRRGNTANRFMIGGYLATLPYSSNKRLNWSIISTPRSLKMLCDCGGISMGLSRVSTVGEFRSPSIFIGI